MTPFSAKSIVSALAFAAATSASAGPVLIVTGASGSSEPGTTSAVSANLEALHLAAGNTVTVSDALPADISAYKQVWDIRFNQALSGGAQAEYTSFLQAGGGLFLMGENEGFMSRNTTILSLISSLGGGAVGFTNCNNVQTVHAPFTGPVAVTTVAYAAPGCFDGTGTGAWITSAAGDAAGSGLAFGVGSLSAAAAGALTTILDVNFMQGVYDLPASQNLTMNLIGFVGDQVDPGNPVPEPHSLALLSLAGMGAWLSRRKRA